MANFRYSRQSNNQWKRPMYESSHSGPPRGSSSSFASSAPCRNQLWSASGRPATNPGRIARRIRGPPTENSDMRIIRLKKETGRNVRTLSHHRQRTHTAHLGHPSLLLIPANVEHLRLSIHPRLSRPTPSQLSSELLCPHCVWVCVRKVPSSKAHKVVFFFVFSHDCTPSKLYIPEKRIPPSFPHNSLTRSNVVCFSTY